MKRSRIITTSMVVVAIVLSLISTPGVVLAAKGGNGQGNNPATGHAPDQDGKGKDNGESDNDGRGPSTIAPDADADSNNGSGNDSDCEDDNNGNGPKKCQPTVPDLPDRSTPPDSSTFDTPSTPDVPTITDGPRTGRVCCVPNGSACEIFGADAWDQYHTTPSVLEQYVLAEGRESFCKDLRPGVYVLFFWRSSGGHGSSPYIKVTIKAGNTQSIVEPRTTAPAAKRASPR